MNTGVTGMNADNYQTQVLYPSILPLSPEVKNMDYIPQSISDSKTDVDCKADRLGRNILSKFDFILRGTVIGAFFGVVITVIFSTPISILAGIVLGIICGSFIGGLMHNFFHSSK